jgi:hypothetical protein
MKCNIIMSALDSVKQDGTQFFATFYGIKDWLAHEFRHLGWMVLALSQNHPEKPYAYAKSLERMMSEIDNKIRLIPANDTIKHADFNQMKINLQVLIHAATRLGITTNLKEQVCATTDWTHTLEGGKRKGKKKRTKKSTKKRTKKRTKKSTKK